MKKVYLISSIASVFLLLCACNTEESLEKKETESSVVQEKSTNEEKSNTFQKEIETIVAHGSYVKYEKESELFEAADLVVIAHTNKDFMDREHIVKFVEQTKEDEGLPVAIEDFHTETPVKIMKVLKEDSSNLISKNDNLNIIEPVSLIEEETVKKLSTENYIEMEKGKPYILYLKKNTYGEYSVINMNNGRFNLAVTDEVTSLSEHGHENDKEKHNEMKKVVEKRFAKEIKDSNNN